MLRSVRMARSSHWIVTYFGCSVALSTSLVAARTQTLGRGDLVECESIRECHDLFQEVSAHRAEVEATSARALHRLDTIVEEEDHISAHIVAAMDRLADAKAAEEKAERRANSLRAELAAKQRRQEEAENEVARGEAGLVGNATWKACKSKPVACVLSGLPRLLQTGLRAMERVPHQFALSLFLVLISVAALFLPARAQAQMFCAFTFLATMSIAVALLFDVLYMWCSAHGQGHALCSPGSFSRRSVITSAAAFSAALLWTGYPGVQILVGAGLGMQVSCVALLAKTWPAADVIGCRVLCTSLGLAASVYQREGVMAVAFAVTVGLFCSVSLCCLATYATQSAGGTPILWTEPLRAVLLNDQDVHSNARTRRFCSIGRTVWFVYILPSLGQLLCFRESSLRRAGGTGRSSQWNDSNGRAQIADPTDGRDLQKAVALLADATAMLSRLRKALHPERAKDPPIDEQRDDWDRWV